jgi:PKD repeat protein
MINTNRTFGLNHNYADNGTYNVLVNVTDKDGGATSLTLPVTVVNVPPTITSVPTNSRDQLIDPNNPVLLLNGQNGHSSLATFTDPGYSAGNTQETFTVTVDWGDGQTSAITLPPDVTTPSDGIGGTVVNGAAHVDTQGTVFGVHRYSGAGSFTVTVTVTDDDGGQDVRTFPVAIGSTSIYTAGAGDGGFPVVNVYDSQFKVLKYQLTAYDRVFRGGVRTAVGDISGDLLPDIITAPGPGGGPHIKVFDGVSKQVIRSFFAYDPSFAGGVYVAVGDVNGDGRNDIITGAGEGGGPHVKVFDGVTGAVIRSFFAFAPVFQGGVRVAAADVDGDGVADIVAAAGPGGGPHVQVFSGATGAVIRSFFAYNATMPFGVYVAAADLNGDAHADIVTGPGVGGPPILRVFDGARGALLIDAYAFPPGTPGSDPFTGNNVWNSGLRVGVTDLDLNGTFEIMVGPGPGKAPDVKVFDFATFTQQLEFLAFDPGFLGGVFVNGN